MNQTDSFTGRAAAAAIVGCAVVALTDIVSWTLLTETYNPISDTISALAVGATSWLLDLGLWTFAAGCLALGVAMLRKRLGGTSWVLAAVAVGLLGPAVVVIAFFNQYAGTQNAGANVHLYAVYVLGSLVALAALLVVPSLRVLDDRLGRGGLAFGVAWIILAPLFFVVPSGWTGGFERLLALMILGWLTAMSVLVMSHA